MSFKKNKSNRINKIIINHLREVKGSLFVGAVCMLGFTIAQILSPWPLKLIFDYILLDKPIPPGLSFAAEMFQGEKYFSVVVLSFSILFIALFRGGFSYLQVFITSRIGLQLVHTLRGKLFSHLQRLSLSFHDRTRSGELVAKITGDTSVLRDVFSETGFVLASHIMTFIGMFFVMFYLSWTLALVIVATFPLLAYMITFLYRRIKKTAKKQRKKEGKVVSRITETLAVIPLVQSFAREQYEQELFEIDSVETLEESIRVARMVAATSRAVEVISALGLFSAVLFGSLQVLKGVITPGDVLIFSAYIKNMYNPVKKIARLSAKVSKAMASAERISDLLETEPEIIDGSNAIKATQLKGEVFFKDISFGYSDGHEILSKVSFKVSSGENVALVGSSGAGKSTIAKLILRLYDVREGVVLIDGIDIKKYQRESLRRQIGIVLQDSILLGTTIRENISYGKPDATREEIEAAAQLAYAHDFISTLPDGYETTVGERGSTLSGGQRQRIGLARAIIKQPSILILDEPTSAVDAESAKLIHDAMDRFQKGKTSLVIVHQFSSIQHYDQIIVLKEGKVVGQGTHEELLNQQGYYEELYRHQKV